MSGTPLLTLYVILLIAACAFFSFSEIGMMAVNRYRLNHLAKKGNKAAARVLSLIKQPDRLLGVILIGNTLVSNLAASLATVLVMRFVSGSSAPVIATIVLTVVMLIFGEVIPKTWAAVQPERVSYPCARVLAPMLSICKPLVIMVNGISNALLKICGLGKIKPDESALSPEELRTVVGEAGSLIPSRHRAMLMSIIDLNKTTINDIMINRHDVEGIDLHDDEETVRYQLLHMKHTRFPVYEGDINNIVGILHCRKLAELLGTPGDLKKNVKDVVSEPYFVPESTQLHTQLHYFQTQHKRLAIVVDEYGDVVGMATLEDILEEIVGDFTSQTQASSGELKPYKAGYLIEGRMSLKEINRLLGWHLSTEGPRTLNGLITETLETIPQGPVSLHLGDYCIEVTELKENLIAHAYCRVF